MTPCKFQHLDDRQCCHPGTQEMISSFKTLNYGFNKHAKATE